MRFFIPAFVAVNSFFLFAYGESITYKVISTPGSNHTMGVVVNGKPYPLQPSKDIPILHSGSAPSGAYSYAKLDKGNSIVEKEPFERQLDQNATMTLNEFYNRTWNTQHITPLPTLLENLPTMHRIDTELHDNNEIPTIYISGNQDQINLMHSNTSLDTKVTVDMHFIKTTKITSLKGIQISLAGRSSKWMDKLSYGLKIPKGQDLFGYRRLKLRGLRADPSYIREILCFDMMKSMGLPVSGASYSRVIMNDTPIGLFLMIEAYKNPWYENEFNNGKKFKDGRGATYQGIGTVSDLSYFGDNITKYDGPYKSEEDPDKKGKSQSSGLDKVMSFTKFLSEAPTTTPDAVKVWNEHIDMESVIRSLVVEIVGGFSDGYLANADNYFLYDNLKEKRFTYLAADFDTTIGNTIVKLADQWSGNYSQYPGFSFRPLAQKMIQVPEFKSRFEQLLHNASQQLIDPKHTNPRIEDLVKMIRQDVDWDYSLPKMNSKPAIDPSMNPFMQAGSLPPPLYMGSIEDLMKRPLFDFDTAVNGPTNHISLPGVKEWFQHQSKAIQDYFAQHPPQ
ncbi:coth protein-domain-containing protein [Halteromyces radiatus]|uniref:coth protein-domain-containing protein n=1 Tax=Halteromyces radiatus TaxID=101107 RepID=UPI00221F9A4E|nr:coth protein-domain-containing protein [Halteromyces radiatus]KAI8099888.1 coth protein-domain-containing protein [Halteromyces radiatus]